MRRGQSALAKPNTQHYLQQDNTQHHYFTKKLPKESHGKFHSYLVHNNMAADSSSIARS
jgi:hypothetical protein